MLLTPAQAANILGITPHQVRALIRKGRLVARKVPTTANQYGFEYVLNPDDVRKFTRRGPGRPPKGASNA